MFSTAFACFKALPLHLPSPLSPLLVKHHGFPKNAQCFRKFPGFPVADTAQFTPPLYLRFIHPLLFTDVTGCDETFGGSGNVAQGIKQLCLLTIW